MANIGIVYKDSYQNQEKKSVQFIAMDIRTITVRKKFTISVNKFKYPDGVVNANITQGKEDHPDYHIWCNMANRGESGKSEIVGNIKDAISENGLTYKKGKLFDPFVSRYNIYFTLFSIDDDKKKDKDHLYNVVAQPYTQQSSNRQQSSNEPPEYVYENIDTGSAASYDDDEAPF